MGCGVIGKDDNVPGTIPGFLERDRNHEEALATTAAHRRLKFDTSGPTPILLVPQPSDDPRDPLNLPRWRRDLNLFILCLLGVLSVCLSSILASNSIVLLVDLAPLNFTQIAGLSSYHLLAVGLGGFVWVSTARVWGKRHVYLLGLVLVVVGSIWAGCVDKNWGSLVGARVLQGIGVAPFEALINASVADLFFVHERGWRMALSNMSIFGGAFFTPVISGVITVNLNWQWTFRFVAIITGALFPLCYLFCFESAWPRAVDCETIGSVSSMLTASSASSGPDLTEVQTVDSEKKSISDTIYATPTLSDIQLQQRKHLPWTFRNSLAIFTGRKTDENFLKIFLRPLPLFLNPGILWACLIQGTMIGWTVFIGIILAAVFYLPPLSFGPEQVGLLYTGACIGSIAAFVVCGLIQDPLTKWLTKRNNGVFEPEFRIPAVAALQLMTGAIGLYGFGFTASNQVVWGYLVPDVFFAFQVASMVCGAIVSAMYIAEAHRDVAIEGFTCLLIFKNVFTFGITQSGVDWLFSNGVERMFVIIGSTQVAIACLSIPMYILGKQNRKLMAKYDVVHLLGLK